MARAFLIVMDSVGCGGAPDAAAFGDEGANTLTHIAQACAAGRADLGRSGPLRMPVLDALGLGAAIRLASGDDAPNLGAAAMGRWGAATEVSRGKDTPSGHWELAGVPVPWDWTYFPDTVPAFSPELVALVCKLAGTGGILGNCHASGVPVLEKHCAEHLRTGWPICYTSADSVFQIDAHEEAFGLERLLKLCQDLAPHLHAMKVGRVIARPFTGTPGDFKRTANRHDYAIAPPAPTLLDWVSGAGRATHAIGKIGDIFSMQGVGRLGKGKKDADPFHHLGRLGGEAEDGSDRGGGATHAIGKIGDIFSMQGVGRLWKGKNDADLFDHLDRLGAEAEDGSLTFANFVEFDSLYGHPRDVAGYARALEWFDARAGAFLAQLRAG